MKVSYNPLWKLLIDRKMKKKEMCALAGISPASCTKMGKGGHVTTEVLMKICMALNCRIEDVMEFVQVEGGYNAVKRNLCARPEADSRAS